MTALHDDPIRVRAIKRAGADDDQADLLHAAELVITSALGSWTMLQRKMRLPQGAAQRVLDVLELHGVVGPEVAGSRRVLVKAVDLDATLARLATSRQDDTSPPANELDDDQIEAANLAPPVASAPAVSLVKATPPPAELATNAGDPGTSLVKRNTSGITTSTTSELDTTNDDDEDEPPADRPPPLLHGVVRRGTSVVHTLRHGDHWTIATGRRTARASYVTGQGVWSWLRRATTASNHGHAREQLKMARLAGDPDQVEKWLKIVDGLRTARIKRLLKLPQALAGVGIAALVAVVVVLALALVVGVLAAIVWGGDGWRSWWWLASTAGVTFAGLVVALVALALALAVPVTVTAAHREGKKVADPPRWLLSLDERVGLDAEITPTRVALALRDCGIPALKTYIKESPDQGSELLSSIAPEGKGIGVLVRLISAVSTEDILKKRRRLAEACDRHEHELLMTIPKAHHIYMWFANPGAMEESIGKSPLVTAPAPIKAHMERGRAPWGETLKGDPVGVNLWQNMLLITGLSNQGKTRALRALALWLAFDTRVHFWCANLKGVDGDWDMFRDLCDPGRFIKGPGVQHAIDATHMVEAAWAEMERRLNSDRTDWDPLVVIVDEAQKAYMNPEKDEDSVPYGGQANNSRYCRAVREIKNQGRVVNVLIWEGTQDPTNQNLPKITREGSHIRISLVVGTPEQARMALGAAAVDGVGGGAPHLLRKDIDRGTVVMHGGDVPIPLGEKALTVRTYHIDDAEAWTVAGRALAKRRARGGMPMVIDAASEKVDHLHHFHEAMRGEDVVRTVVVLGRLMEDRPEMYEAWDTQDTNRVLNAYAAAGIDIAIRKRDSGQRCLVLEEVENALRARTEVLP